MYQVQLQNFEGPLDLLLFFIKRDELDIYDIPISYITEQFLDYIHFLDELDLGIASEFIYMASTLMAIKARMMLPREESDDEELSEDDPRYELVQSLLEYKRYKEMAEDMIRMDFKAREHYSRGYTEPDIVEKEEESPGDALHEITLLDLMAAFKNAMFQQQEEMVHSVEKIETSVEMQSSYVLDTLQTHGRSSFIALCNSLKSRIMVVVTFLAILELAKEQQVVLYVGDDSRDFHLDLPAWDETQAEAGPEPEINE